MEKTDLQRARELFGDECELLTVKEYALRCGIHEQTVYSAVRYGYKLQGLAIRVSKRVIRIAVPRGSVTIRAAS
jgi:hypothetical protein